MNLPGDVAGRMEYIQKLFLDVGQATEKINSLKEIIGFLDKEPREFRSIAYESASMVIGLKDLYITKTLNDWEEFREACRTEHSFHIDIGLGWAFAKMGMYPEDFLRSANPVVKRMVLDGIGYYYALFKGRSTIKSKDVPGEIKEDDINGFDQGLGRRLWYMVKGSVNDLAPLLQSFDGSRHADLWQGVGIACAYVGGNKEQALEDLLNAARDYKKQLCIGITLAAISRIASASINEDVKLAYRIVCNKAIEDLNINEVANNFFYLYKNDGNSDWLSLL